MKRAFNRVIAGVLMSLPVVLPSCKKITHDTHPTPGNYRLMGYSIVTDSSILKPTPRLTQVISENYSFSYNGNNQLSQVIYTTNDSNAVKAQRGQLISVFDYSGNTVYKTTSLSAYHKVIQRDTFIKNGAGFITNAQFQNMVWTFSYYGQLVYHETFLYRDTGTTVAGSATYTSSSGDFLKRTFDGNLTATFPDSGLRPVVIYPDTTRDSILLGPLTVTWTTLGTGGATVTHSSIASFTDQFTGYSEFPITVMATGTNNIRTRPVTLPGDIGAAKEYLFYGDANRMGDYFQLQAFSTYGVNLYMNATLVKEIKSAWYTVDITYVIDADSKITSETVVSVDRFGNVVTSTYHLQYATN